MGESVATGLLAAYYAVLFLLSLYGLHRLRLLLLLRSRAVEPGGDSTLEPAAAELPPVTVQLPIYNELHVAPRLLDAVCRLHYPRDRLEIQVLDDSTDETAAILAEKVTRLRAEGHDICHLRRRQRLGYKAGALAAGLERAKGELIAIFDADFVPPADFLRRTVPCFADPGVGMVQAAWDYLNREDSLLTRVQAVLLDGHFQVEHQARCCGRLFFNFNGTAGVWRSSAIASAGGWQQDTLTEDLDLSYRAQLAGWRFVFLPRLLVPSELPIDIAAFKSQQHRWTHGAAQTLRKLAPSLLRSQLGLRLKLEALLHLGANLCYPLMVALVLLLFPAMSAMRVIGGERMVALHLLPFLAGTVSIVTFYVHSQRRLGRSSSEALSLQLPLMALGIGMSLHNARAALTGLYRRGGVFVRTPKYRSGGGDRRYRSRVRPLPVGELLMAGYLVTCLALAALQQLWWSLPFLGLFFCGYLYVAVLALVPARTVAEEPQAVAARSQPLGGFGSAGASGQ